MRIIIFVNTSWNIYNFRAELIRELRKAGHEIHAVAPEDSYSIHLTAMGCVYHPVQMNNTGNNPWQDLTLIRQVCRLYREINPGVVLHYTIKPNIYGSLVARYLGIPSICTISGLGTVFLTSGKSNNIARLLFKKAFKYPQVIFFQNQSDLEIFRKNGLLRSGNYQVIPGSGIDVRRFTKRRSTPAPPPFVFLLIARLIEEKGVRTFMEASKTLRSEGLAVTCQILGSPDPKHKRGIPLSEIETYPVEYLGETEDVRDFIDRCHVVVLPSFREGLSRSLLEAAAMEKPTIASAVPGCTEVVKDQINGLLCRPGDSSDLSDKMREIQSYSLEKLNDMGAAGRSLVMAQFTVDRVNKHYLDVIREIEKQALV